MVMEKARDMVHRLKDHNLQSTHLDRLRQLVSAEEQQASLEAEIRQEMANSLGRAATKVDVALLELELIEQEVRQSGQKPTAEQIERYNQQRELALRARLDLRIHREAVGLRNNDGLKLTYPIAEAWREGQALPGS